MPNALVAAAGRGLPELSQLTVAELAFVFETATTAAIAIGDVQNNPRCTRDAWSMLAQHTAALWSLAGEVRDIVSSIRPRGGAEVELCARVLLTNAALVGEWHDAYRAVALLKAGA